MHVLAEAERGGSTCLPPPALLAEAGELLGAEVDEASDRRRSWPRATRCARTSGSTGAPPPSSRPSWPRAWMRCCAARRAQRLGEDRGVGTAPRDSDAPSELTAEQQAALEAAFEHRLSVITGGPGTGKTASIKTIAASATDRGARVMLVAPTGRAAVRMTEASGLRARTVHSALGWIPGEGPTHDEQDPLSCDLLIVDETSMANLELLVTLLRAVGDGTHVVLVGDADQLAPVGAGKPFAELVASERVPMTRLTHIFRQAAGSMIVQGAHAIRRGDAPAVRAPPRACGATCS